MPLILLLLLSSLSFAAKKQDINYEYKGFNLKLELSSLKSKFPNAFHQYMVRDTNKVFVLNRIKEEDFYSGMMKQESIYSVSTNEIKDGNVLPISPEVQSAKLLVKESRLKGLELTLMNTACLSAQKLFVTKYGRPDSQNIAVGSRVWFWESGRQSLVLDEVLCKVHINWDQQESAVPRTKTQ